MIIIERERFYSLFLTQEENKIKILTGTCISINYPCFFKLSHNYHMLYYPFNDNPMAKHNPLMYL